MLTYFEWYDEKCNRYDTWPEWFKNPQTRKEAYEYYVENYKWQQKMDGVK
jgi:hypothetical protein